MSKVIFIVGLPGSGKTMFIKNNYPELYNADDLMRYGLNNRKKFCDSIHYNKIIETLKNNSDCVLSDIKLCNYKFFYEITEELSLKFPDIKYEILCFDNDQRQCMLNVRSRSEKMKNIYKRNRNKYIELINITRLSFRYDLTNYANARVLKVFSPD